MSRIFIAIRFNNEFKKKLVAVQNTLKERGVHGNYCSYGNLHMTLAFIGEHYDLPAIRKAVSEVEFEPFKLSLGKLGSFPTKAGVTWCGVNEYEPVTTIAKQLRERLTAHGVSYSTLAFVPHISLVQHPSEIITDIEIPDATANVERIYVMKSERIDGELVYSELEQTMKKVKITAIRKVQYDDLMAKYENPIEHTCDVCEGQTWISEDGKCPERMCPEAWKTMKDFVEALAQGEGNFYDGWMKNPYSAMISCNDGFRPVSFYIETIED